MLEGWLQLNYLAKIENVLSRALADVGMNVFEVEQIILFGESSNIPIIARRVTKFFKQRSKMIDDPGEVVGKGNAVSVELSREQAKRLKLSVGRAMVSVYRLALH
jgi:molecular chaperone DnaK (HSP70)